MKYSYIVLRTALAALSNNVSKLVLNTIPLYHFMVIRQFIGLTISILGYRNWRRDFAALQNNKHIYKSLVIGALLGTGNSLLFYKGLSELPLSIVATLINTLNLISTTIIGVLFFKQRHTIKFYILLTLLIPATMMLVITNFSEGFNVSILGLLCLMGSATLYATSDHMTKEQVDIVSVHGVVIFKSTLSLGCIVVLAVVKCDSIIVTKESLTVGIITLLVYSSINSLIVTALHIKSIKELGATVTTLFTSLTPVFTILFALLLFNETLQVTQWVGIAITVTLLYFIAREQQ